MRKPYRSDLTDDQRALIGPLLPPAKPDGRPRTADLREVVKTLLYLDRTGCQWDYLLAVKQNQEGLYRDIERIGGHWGIENGLRWILDVCFGEYASRLREGHGPENMTLPRKLALAVLKNGGGTKENIRGKRLIAGWDDAYLERLLLEFLRI